MSIYEFPVELEKKIAFIRNQVESQKSIFSDKRYLDSLHLPSGIIGRECQAEKLIKHLDTRNGFLSPFISVYGRSGSGKSTVVGLVCESMSDVISTKTVTLRKAKTTFGCANLILAELGKKELKSADGIKKAIDAVENRIEEILNQEKKKFFVLVLDEFDVIFSDKNDPSDFVYKLLTLSENLRKKELWLCIISISNSSMVEQDFDDRVKSRIGSAEVYFEPYKENDIFNILYDRAQKSLENKIDTDTLRHIAKLCSDIHGDARRAIELLRVSAELSNGAKISKDDVDKASAEIQKDRCIDILKNSSRHFRYAFVGLARISFLLDKQWHTTHNIYEQYKMLISDDSKMISYRRFSDILKEIEQAGLCVSKTGSKGRYGYNKEFMLTVPPEIITFLNQKEWEDWRKMKKGRFKMRYHPSSKPTSYDGRLMRYGEEKTWHRLLGCDTVPED